MIYIVLSVILCVVFATLNIFWKTQKISRKILFYINSATAASGTVMISASYFISYSVLNSSKSSAAEWAWDMISVYFELSFPICAVLLGIIIITAIIAWKEKQSRTGFKHTMRGIASVFASALMLIIGGFYSVTTKNSDIPLEIYIYISSFGQAMLFRVLYAVEYRSHILSSVKKK